MYIAIHHFHNNMTDKQQLLDQLLLECSSLAESQGQSVAQQCTMIVNANIDKIYDDLQSQTVLYTCQDIGICGPNATAMPPPPEVTSKIYSVLQYL